MSERRRSVLWIVTLASLAVSAIPAGANGNGSSCAADPAWFTSPSFPVEVADQSSNCSFHQFAWQAFIAAVQPAGGERVWEAWMPDYGVFVPQGQSPTPWGQQPPAPCAGAGGANASVQFVKPRFAKSDVDTIDPNGSKQATGDPLYDQNNALVYYGTWIDQVAYNFITSCQFYNSGCVSAAPATTAFPATSTEIKTAWRTFPQGQAPANFYTIDGVVGPNCQPVTLALVGFHLVRNTPDHPEFIWATFEHVANAPDCDNTSQPPPGGDWSFYNPSCTTCPTNEAGTIPTQVCRVNPEGGGNPPNQQNIASLNQSVWQTLRNLQSSDPTRYGPMAVWLNYEMTGNLWTLDGQLPPTDSNERGSLIAANTTLETFIQTQNCFLCHTVNGNFAGSAPANLSHLWFEVQQTGGCSGGSLPAACQPTPSAARTALKSSHSPERPLALLRSNKGKPKPKN